MPSAIAPAAHQARLTLILIWSIAALAALFLRRAAARVTCLLFGATAAGLIGLHVGSDGPAGLRHDGKAGAFGWFREGSGEGGGVESGILLMVVAGFVKHNFITVPVVCLLWLTL